MSQSRGSLRQVAYGVESEFGVTPGVPSTSLVEFTEAKFSYSAAEVVDDSVNAYRQTLSTRKGNVTVGLELDANFCPVNYDAFLEAGFLGTWTTDVLKVATVATAVRRSFYFEEGFTDVESGSYQVYNGLVVNTINLNLPADNEFCSASFGFIGTRLSVTSGTSIDSTPTAVIAKEKFFHEDGSISIDSVVVGYIQSMEITLDNGYDTSYTFGSVTPYDLPFGNASVTGKVTAVLDTMDQWDKYKAGTPVAFSVVLTLGAESYTIAIPQAQYTYGSIVTSGDSGITVEFDFRAEYNTAAGTSMSITRV